MNNLFSGVRKYRSSEVTPFCSGSSSAPLLLVLLAHRIDDGLLTFCRRSSENCAKIGLNGENACFFFSFGSFGTILYSQNNWSFTPSEKPRISLILTLRLPK